MSTEAQKVNLFEKKGGVAFGNVIKEIIKMRSHSIRVGLSPMKMSFERQKRTPTDTGKQAA